MQFVRATFMMALALTAPCVSAGPLKIMAMGDSITHGVDGSSTTGDATGGGYRPLFSAKMNGIAHQWDGRRPDGPAIALRHEGWDGYSIRQFNLNIVSDAFAEYTPDVVLLMIGTNDAWRAPIYNDPLTTRENMLPNLKHLLINIHNHVPLARLVVSTIPPIGFSDPVIDQARENYNNGLDELMQDLQGDGFNIGLVNAGGRVPTTMLPDGVHPNAAGYQLIADGFLEAFVLPNTPEPALGSFIGVLALLIRRSRRHA